MFNQAVPKLFSSQTPQQNAHQHLKPTIPAESGTPITPVLRVPHSQAQCLPGLHVLNLLLSLLVPAPGGVSLLLLMLSDNLSKVRGGQDSTWYPQITRGCTASLLGTPGAAPQLLLMHFLRQCLDPQRHRVPGRLQRAFLDRKMGQDAPIHPSYMSVPSWHLTAPIEAQKCSLFFLHRCLPPTPHTGCICPAAQPTLLQLSPQAQLLSPQPLPLVRFSAPAAQSAIPSPA